MTTSEPHDKDLDCSDEDEDEDYVAVKPDAELLTNFLERIQAELEQLETEEQSLRRAFVRSTPEDKPAIERLLNVQIATILTTIETEIALRFALQKCFFEQVELKPVEKKGTDTPRMFG